MTIVLYLIIACGVLSIVYGVVTTRDLLYTSKPMKVAIAGQYGLADGRIVCTLRHPWHDGTRHLIFTPHEFLERLAAITPTVLSARVSTSSARFGIATATASSPRSRAARWKRSELCGP